jgi:hypothetical protein
MGEENFWASLKELLANHPRPVIPHPPLEDEVLHNAFVGLEDACATLLRQGFKALFVYAISTIIW